MKDAWPCLGPEAIRQALNDAGLTVYRVRKDTGVSFNTVSRFARGAAIRSDHLDILAEYLRLKIVPKPPTKRKGV